MPAIENNNQSMIFEPGVLGPSLALAAAKIGAAAAEGYILDCHMRLGIRNGELASEQSLLVVHGIGQTPLTSFAAEAESYGARTTIQNTAIEYLDGRQDITVARLTQKARRDTNGRRQLQKLTLHESTVTHEDATLLTIPEMAQDAARSGAKFSQLPLWALRGNHRGFTQWCIGTAQLAPVIGKLVEVIGTYAAEAPGASRRYVDTRLGVNFSTSGEGYGFGAKPQGINLYIADAKTTSQFTFKFGGVQPIAVDTPYAFAECRLSTESKENGQRVTDTLQQYGREFRRIRQSAGGETASPANGETVLDMARLAISLGHLRAGAE